MKLWSDSELTGADAFITLGLVNSGAALKPWEWP